MKLIDNTTHCCIIKNSTKNLQWKISVTEIVDNKRLLITSRTFLPQDTTIAIKYLQQASKC